MPVEITSSMPNANIPYQYGSQPPNDSTSPIHGADAGQERVERLDLKSTQQRQSSQIELLTRELRRTQARVRDLESQLQQIISTLRRDQ